MKLPFDHPTPEAVSDRQRENRRSVRYGRTLYNPRRCREIILQMAKGGEWIGAISIFNQTNMPVNFVDGLLDQMVRIGRLEQHELYFVDADKDRLVHPGHGQNCYRGFEFGYRLTNKPPLIPCTPAPPYRHKKKMKTYSIAYWCKNALRYESKPEELIANAVAGHAMGKENGIAFSGSSHELLNQLYTEWRKGCHQVHGCLFPTPLPVARELATFANVCKEDIVFDPGCGLGNLLAAATERGAQAFGVEIQYWLPPIGEFLKLNIQRGDYLDGYKPGPFTVVLTNPPFGNLFGHPDIAAAFLEQIANQSAAGTRVAAILPKGYVQSERPAKRRAILKRFQLEATKDLPADTFKPLTSVETEMTLLRVATGAPTRVASRLAGLKVSSTELPWNTL